MTNGIDTAADCTGFADCIAADGNEFVARYYRPGARGAITAVEAAALVRAGLQLVVVFEGQGDSPAWFTPSQGARDARRALEQAAAIGQPAGSAIYFAVDLNAEDGLIATGITSYFGAIRSVFAGVGNRFRIGVYGSGRVCMEMTRAGFVHLGWLSGSTGWRGYRDYLAAADIVQIFKPGETICGGRLDIDRDRGQTADFGAFSVPLGAAPAPPIRAEAIEAPVAPAPAAALGPAAARIAEAEGNARHHPWGGDPRVEAYMAPLRDALGQPRGRYPWCGAFVTWCWRQAGVTFLPDRFPTGLTPAFVPAWVTWADKVERWRPINSGYAPRAGDAVIFEWNGDDQPDHIGIYLRADDADPSAFYSAEGNTTVHVDGANITDTTAVQHRFRHSVRGFVAIDA
jgi:hypothetical protein